MKVLIMSKILDSNRQTAMDGSGFREILGDCIKTKELMPRLSARTLHAHAVKMEHVLSASIILGLLATDL